MLSENLRNLLRERYSIFTPHMERQAKLLLLAVVLIFVGLIFNLIAIFTPAWQVGYVERMNDTIENGLWLHCENSPLIGTGCVTLFDKIPSTTARSFTDFLHLSRQKDKKDEADYSVEDSFPFIDRTGMHSSNFESRRDASVSLFFGSSQEALLALYVIAIMASVWAAFAGFWAIFRKGRIFEILLDVFIGVAIILSMSALLLFIKTSQSVGVYVIQIKSRYMEEIRGTYGRTKGYSFYLELIGALFWLLAAIPSVIGTRCAQSKSKPQTWNTENYVKIGHVRNSSYDKALRMLDSRSPTHSYVSIATAANSTAETLSILTRSASVPGIQAEHAKSTSSKSKNSKALAPVDEIDWRASSRTVGW